MRKLLITLLVLIAVGLGVFFYLPKTIDSELNTVAAPPTYHASDAAANLHERLFVADLHSDTLLWNRNLLERHDFGHIDLPRLLQGHVGLQVFSTVTKSPRGLNYENNDDNSDNITLLAIAQRWPSATWNSLLERALYQGQRLQQAADDSQGSLVLIRSREAFTDYLTAWEKDPKRVAAILATEGLHPLQGKLENVDRLYDAGFRIAGLTHFFDNEIGGSAHGLEKGGLTPFGRRVIARLEEKGILLDLAHASRALIDDVLNMTERPVLVSHTGVEGTCQGTRNLSDAHLQRIAASGGVIGIGYWDAAVCDTSVKAIVRAIRHTANKVGVAHVALGSDFDGTIHAPFDTSGLAQLTQGLLAAGFSPADITAIMGGNVRRLLLESLP